VTGKIKSVLTQLDRLGAAVDGAGDGDELKRRVILFEWVSSVLRERMYVLTKPRALEGIKDELLEISYWCNAPDYERNETDIRTICGLAEALRDAIVEYQVRTKLEAPH